MSGTELQIGASYVGIHIRATSDQTSVYFRYLSVDNTHGHIAVLGPIYSNHATSIPL